MELEACFPVQIEDLKCLLQSSIVVDEFRARQTDSFRHKLEGILSEPKKRHGRTDEAIIGDIVSGMVAEVGVSDLLGVEVFDAPFVLKDRSSFAQDVIYNNLRIEIKSHKHLRRFSISEHSYHTMIRSLAEGCIDAIVFAHVQRLDGAIEGQWLVKPTLIVDPYPSIVAIEDLFYMDDHSYVYRADLASKRNLCHPFIDLDP